MIPEKWEVGLLLILPPFSQREDGDRKGVRGIACIYPCEYDSWGGHLEKDGRLDGRMAE